MLIYSLPLIQGLHFHLQMTWPFNLFLHHFDPSKARSAFLLSKFLGEAFTKSPSYNPGKKGGLHQSTGVKSFQTQALPCSRKAGNGPGPKSSINLASRATTLGLGNPWPMTGAPLGVINTLLQYILHTVLQLRSDFEGNIVQVLQGTLIHTKDHGNNTRWKNLQKRVRIPTLWPGAIVIRKSLFCSLQPSGE